MSLSLSSMPEVVMDEIMKELDFSAIQSLRKVCRDLRNFIDDTYQTGNLNSVKILIDRDKITVDYESIDRISYKNDADGCSVEYKNKEKILKNEDYTNRFLEDLSLNLRLSSPKPVLIEFFGFYPICSIEEQPAIFRFLGTIEFFLKCQKSKIQVSKFQMEVMNSEQVIAFLPYLEPKVLEEVRILENKAFSYFHWIDLTEIVKTEQWKLARKVFVQQVFEKNNLSDFGRFEKVWINMEKIDLSDDLEILKEIFFKSTTLQLLLISYKSIDMTTQFPQNKTLFFEISNSEDVLEIRHEEQTMHLRFQRIAKEKVPLKVETAS